MYTAIIELVRKFLPQILAAIAFIAVLSILYYKVYDNGYQAAKEKYTARYEAATKARDDAEQATLAKRQNEYAAKLHANSVKYTEMIGERDEKILSLNNDLASTSDRLRVKARCPSSGNNLPPAPENTGGDSSGFGELFQTVELAGSVETAIREYNRETESAKIDAALTVKFLRENNLVGWPDENTDRSR